MIPVDIKTHHVLLNDEANNRLFVQRWDEIKHRFGGWGPEYEMTEVDGKVVLQPLSKFSPDAISKMPKVFATGSHQTVRYFAEKGWKPESSLVIPYDDPRGVANGRNLGAPLPNVSNFAQGTGASTPIPETSSSTSPFTPQEEDRIKQIFSELGGAMMGMMNAKAADTPIKPTVVPPAGSASVPTPMPKATPKPPSPATQAKPNESAAPSQAKPGETQPTVGPGENPQAKALEQFTDHSMQRTDSEPPLTSPPAKAPR